MDIDIMWGGYYASREPEGGLFGVFRLLDFTQNAYHAALYRQKFPSIPTLAEVATLAAGIGHVPLDTRGLFAPPIQLIGAAPLTPSDLEGYLLYLEHHGFSSEERVKLESKIIGFSREAPLRLRLAIIDGQIQIAQRP